MGQPATAQLRKHIAVIGTKGLPAKGGVERVSEAIIRKAMEQGYRVSVYSKNDYIDGFQGGPGSPELIPIRYLKGKHLGATSYGFLSALHALFFGKYDLVHLHSVDNAFLIPLLRLRYKVIATSHGAEYYRDKWGKFAKFCFKIFEFPFLKYSNIATCVSKSLSEYYYNKIGKLIYYIPNGITITQLDNLGEVTLKKYNLPKDGFLLFSAARIIPSKGCDLLLKANNLLKLKMPVVIVGKWEDDAEYKQYIQSLARENVVFLDFIKSKRDLFELISNCKFFMFPSTYEAMSIMLLEVCFLKKPIICSDIIQNIDTIGDNALYFNSGDYEGLADKIKYGLQNEAQSKKMAQSAYDWVARNRNWDSLGDKYLHLYEQLLT
jgi:glycosyltransferase involved in cell wall biosynthesis